VSWSVNGNARALCQCLDQRQQRAQRVESNNTASSGSWVGATGGRVGESRCSEWFRVSRSEALLAWEIWSDSRRFQRGTGDASPLAPASGTCASRLTNVSLSLAEKAWKQHARLTSGTEISSPTAAVVL